jgi:Sugar phosphate isomerases/epimerases
VSFRLAFSTLGCPEWSWEAILDQASRMGYQGIELRGLGKEIDVIWAGPFQPENLARTKEQLAEKGLAICCLGSSVRFDDANQLERHLEAGRAYIDLARELSAPYVRVFGDKIPSPELGERVTAQVVEGLESLGAYAKERGVQVLIETHGDFSQSQRLKAVLERVQSDAVGILWDMHHPWRFHGENLEESYGLIGRWVRHVHLKDSVRTGTGYRYTLPGEGEFPWEEALALLKRMGYQGWLSLEWEKRWHPDIEPPEAAFPRFVEVVTKHLS